MGTGGKAFGPLAWLRLPHGLTGVTPPQSGWRWQGLQGQRVRRQQRSLSLPAGKRLALVKSRIGCCLAATVPTTIPYHPHGEENPATTLLQGGGMRAPPRVSVCPHLALLVPLLSQFPAGKWKVQEVEGQSPGGDVVALGQPEWSGLPPGGGGLAMREPGGGQQEHVHLPFGIPGAPASPASLGGATAVPGSPFPRNRWRGCPFFQSSSSWQPPGCQG